VRHSVFVIEVCARIDTTPQLLDELLPILQTAPPALSRQDAWDRHATAADILLRHFDAVERGCWEYFDDELTVKAMFDEWCGPVVERQIPRQVPSEGLSYREEAGPRSMTFTVVYLLAYGSPSDLEVRATCDIPPEALWRRGTFRQLLGLVRTLSFASVKGDAMYMIPRDIAYGLTPGDIAKSEFDYLRPVSD
jgi:hypothetical protein